MKHAKKHSSNDGRAITLIETAAVITVASGAMALVLPTLQQARESARLQTCLSNLGQVTRAFVSYGGEYAAVPMPPTNDLWANWLYGGWSGNNRAYWESADPAYNMQTADKPLSVYMTPFAIPKEVNRYAPTMEMPVFKCPSDIASAQWQWGSWPNADLVECQEWAPNSAYEDVGTSYQMNWHWWEQVDNLTCSWTPDWFCQYYYGNQIFLKYMDKAASRFVILMEDRLDMGFGFGGGDNPGVLLEGFHREFGKHVVGFADGSVQYLYFDSRHEHDSLPVPPGLRHGRNSNNGSWSVCDWQRDHPSGGRHL